MSLLLAGADAPLPLLSFDSFSGTIPKGESHRVTARMCRIAPAGHASLVAFKNEEKVEPTAVDDLFQGRLVGCPLGAGGL